MNYLKPIISLLSLLLLSTGLLAQLQINVSSIPASTPDNATIYVAGTFNNWAAGNDDYTLTENGDGTYQITVNPAPGEVKFKFTRGSWATVEGQCQWRFSA